MRLPEAATDRVSTIVTSSAASAHINTTTETMATLAGWGWHAGMTSAVSAMATCRSSMLLDQVATGMQQAETAATLHRLVHMPGWEKASREPRWGTAQHVSSQHSRGHQTSCKHHNNGPGQQQAGQYPDKQREVEAMLPVQNTNH